MEILKIRVIVVIKSVGSNLLFLFPSLLSY